VIAGTQAIAGGANSSVAATTTTTATASGLSLVVEPDAGLTPLYALLRSARKSVDLVMYELEDTQAEAILAQDEARGVKVQVLLDKSYVGKYNQPAFSYLQAHQVAVRWAPSHFELTHEKAMVIDDKVAAVMTLNFTAQYYSSTRDFALIDNKTQDVAAIETTFAIDWAGSSTTAPKGSDLLWSPGAEQSLASLISSSHHSLLVENEETGDTALTGALEAAARRGVQVEVVMTRQTSWSKAFDALTAAGAAVRTYAASASLYIHAKAIVVDSGYSGAKVFVGSQNFSVTSLLHNRELGVITSDPALVSAVAAVVKQDAAGGALWR
jgi:phosphatidylserine/phosphatidylglycerophosphate/cardiolipin synthase-like enzyme